MCTSTTPRYKHASLSATTYRLQLLDLFTNALLLGANPQFSLLRRGDLPEQLVHLSNGAVLLA